MMVCSKKLFNDLASKGVIQNKTYLFGDTEAELLWKSIPDTLIPDFLRGFMDGDGHVRFFKQNGKTESCNLSWCGPKSLLTKISNWLDVEFNYIAKVNHVSGTKQLYRVSITKPSVADEVCKKMYANFKWPFGNPVKTSRVWDRIKFKYLTEDWGSESFNVIVPCFGFSPLESSSWIWAESMDNSERSYKELTDLCWSPQQARSVLPNSLKTEIVVTGNFREWRHFFKLRCATSAHPQMREVALMALEDISSKVPVLFDDLKDKFLLKNNTIIE
jgi:hypothetical protein